MHVQDRVSITLTITSGSASPEEISRLVGTPFDDAHRVGERKGASELKWEENVWRLVEQAEAPHPDQLSGDLLARCWKSFEARIGPFTQEIRALATKTNLKLLEIGIFVLSEKDSVPPFSLDREAVELIAKLVASLDVDIMFYASENDGEQAESSAVRLNP